MIDIVKHVTVKDTEYPIAFTLNVMADIQEKYGSLEAWQDILKPKDGTEANFRDIIYSFRLFINEGIEIENDERGEQRPPVTDKQAGRIISSIGLSDSGKLIGNLVVSSSKKTEENKEDLQDLDGDGENERKNLVNVQR